MGEAPYAPPEVKRKTGLTLGIIGTVVGALGLCVGVGCAALGYVFAIAALVLGIIGLSKGKEDEDPQKARTFAIIAIVLGVLTLLISCVNSVIGAYMGMTGQIDWQELFRQMRR